MNKSRNYIVYFFIIFIVSLGLCSCKNNDGVDDEILYPNTDSINYSEMDIYETSYKKDNSTYNYTFYFEDDVCMNALVSIVFSDKQEAQAYYNSIKESEEFINIVIEDLEVKYYYNPENFIYMMYTKDMLIDLLNKDELMIE